MSRHYKYNVLTGLQSWYCEPYRTNSYFKAVIALLYRRIRFFTGWIYIEKDYYKFNK